MARNILKSRAYHDADALFACSDLAGKWLYGKRREEKTYYILKNAINVDEFKFDKKKREKIRAELNINCKFTMGTVGRLTPQKNPYCILEIAKEFCAIHPNSVFLWVGKGELEGDIKSKAVDMGIGDNIIFTGVRADIPSLLSAMDVFVFPSLWEGLPVSVIEAQASGLPCLISDTITDEVCVSPLIKPLSIENNVQEWVNEIEKIEETPYRMDVSEMIRNAGYAIKDSAEWISDFYMSCYRNIRGEFI
ncbi:MAG: glycosyltransferase [Lachnospiraceae bacterium]|nr:glycosyltransferase [Lachnospiraceae bacterium]